MITPKTPDLGSDLFSTDLIAKLANQFFNETPGIPSKEMSLPRDGHSADGISQYPSHASEVSPPVHAGATLPSEPESNDQAVGSGGHQEDPKNSFDFGETRSCGRGTSSKKSPTAASQSGYSMASIGEPLYFLSGKSGADLSPFPGLSQNTYPGLSTSSFDVESVRKDFPALHQQVNGRPLIWLDNAATTHKPQSVIDATSYFYSTDNSNIHRAAHTLAARSTDAFEGAREKIRRFIGAGNAKEIVFVRGTTEAINLVAQTFGKQNISAGDEIIVTTIEHHANIVPWQMLAQQTGAVLRVAPVNDRGELMMDQFVALLSARTKLVSITHVANSLGTINPVEQIIAVSHAYGVPVLLDAAQSAPHIPINVSALDVDFLALSGHKIFGPTGIGILYGKSALLESMPPYQGGGHMIRDVTFAKTIYANAPEKFEAGTPDIAGAVGLGAAVEYLEGIGMSAISAYEHELLEYATDALREVPGLRMIGTAAQKASVLSFVIAGTDPDKVGVHLDKYGIAARSGHHCAQPALRRFGYEKTVRASLAFYNTHDEVDFLVRALKQIRLG